MKNRSTAGGRVRPTRVGGPVNWPEYWLLGVAVVVLVGLLAGGVVLIFTRSGPTVFRPRMPADGLVTNELTQHASAAQQPHRSRDWVVTSGSLFAVGGMGWSGRPDDKSPDAESRNGTNSAVFRVVSRRRDFADVRVRFALRVSRLVRTRSTPKETYDGVHLLLRYRSPQQLYAVSLQRRDKILAIKRKDPGGPSNGGTYTVLSTAPFPLLHDWINVDVTVRDTPDGSTALDLHIDGRLIMVAVDRSAHRITGPGGIGLRADNAEFFFKDMIAEPVQ